jgi:alpha-1,3-rhamnosyl/mannosyltransferase
MAARATRPPDVEPGPLPEPTRIILNDRVLYRPLTGVGHYVSQLLRAWSELSPAGIEIVPLLGQRFKRPAPAGPGPAPTGKLGRRWHESELVRGVLRRMAEPPYEAWFRFHARQYTLYHEPNHIPIRSTRPTITTIHDISVLTHPEWHPEHRVRWYERHFERGRRQTARFIAASEFTRRELTDRMGIPAEVIDVTLQAARPEFTPRPPEQCRRACAEFGLPETFFLFVGTLEPRKNVSTLLEAHAHLPANIRRSHPLVLVGAWGWRNEALNDMLASRARCGDLRLLGYLDNEALACLYSACTALVWPSLYEGFGLPPLEAMACGGPVIVSNAAALPEVVGGAAPLLDPRDAPAWAEAMRRMAEDDAWRGDWRGRGLRQATTFSWRRCAEQTLECYRKATR